MISNHLKNNVETSCMDSQSIRVIIQSVFTLVFHVLGVI